MENLSLSESQDYGLVSIIMPSYNTSRFIAQSITSIQNQSYPSWELIIIDDHSTDDTDDVVARFLSDPRITYQKNAINHGAAYSRNAAVSLARGRWIAFLDSDDLWEPCKLEHQLSFMAQNGAAFSYTAYKEISESGMPNGKTICGPKKITFRGMCAFCWPGCLTVMYDRTVIHDTHIINIAKNNDYAIWLKACRYADCYFLPEILACYRRRAGSISRHNYFHLIRWHYRLWRESENKCVISALFFTGLNVLCGIYKKLVFTKRQA